MRLMPAFGMKATTVGLSLFLLAAPFVAQAQTGADANTAMIDAQQDARMESNDFLYFLAGCLGGPLGIEIAYSVEPSPPATRMLGKSAEYVAVYSDTFRRSTKDSRTKMAWVGCGAIAAFYVVLVIISATSQSSRTN